MLQVIDDPKKQLLNLCCSIAGNRTIVAACLYGPSVSGYGDKETDINILLVLDSLSARVRAYQKQMGDKDALVLAADQGAFQKDIASGWLGEVAADKLLTPYEPFVNEDYLRQQEVLLKKRIIWELLETIALEFPELSHELLIEQEYFMLETHMQRARLFPLIAFRFLNILQNSLKEKNSESMMKGYRKALDELAREKWITLTDGIVKLTPKLVSAIKSRRIRVPVFLKTVQRAALLHVYSALPKMLSPLAAEEELYLRNHSRAKEYEDVSTRLEDPRNHLLIPTPLGPVPISDASTIEDFARKSIPDTTALDIQAHQIGGVLNSVYKATLKKGQREQKIVVKKFKNWAGFKWFPLALWSLGTKSFAVLGKSRLEREYALNQYLRSRGLTVPKILHISPKQSLVFQEFVEGRTLAETLKEIISARNNSDIETELGLVKEAGMEIARAHGFGVALGDCKPENIIVTNEGRLCFVDLEQASRDGNQAWDIAEFVYYSGHYVPPLATTHKIERIAAAFLEGYVEAGGRKENIMKAASPRYTKVFSLFTQPHVILALSNLCRRGLQK